MLFGGREQIEEDNKLRKTKKIKEDKTFNSGRYYTDSAKVMLFRDNDHEKTRQKSNRYLSRRW